jgi:threonylcarbamoyladenosine tRNA methylthiotransferase MtaB
MRIRLEALGCRLNEAELQLWARQFQTLGHQPVENDQPADLVIVNTCAVTAEAVRKSRQLLRRARRHNPRARLIVSGCATALPDAQLDLTGIDLLISNADKDQLVEIAQREFALPVMPVTAEQSQMHPLFARGRQRAFIKIQDGCRHQCTFCVTTLARGPERSRTPHAIIADIQAATAVGIQEAVLTGVHLAGYGRDLDLRLEDLLAKVLSETEIPRLRLGSLEPWGLRESFWALFDNPRLMPHLHLPLQSGSDRMLRLMARRCTADAYRALIHRARRDIADFLPTTDIIVGFPGETEADWEQTLALVSEIGFSQLHVFPYSPRPGTRAAEQSNQIPGEVKRERLQTLQQLSEQQRGKILQAYLGRTLAVLWESGAASSGGETPFGYTPNYLPVRLCEEATHHGTGIDWINRIVPVTLTGVSPDGGELLGKIASGQ